MTSPQERRLGQADLHGWLTEVTNRLVALAEAERALTKAPETSRTERACHKAAAEAYDNALGILMGEGND